MELEELDFALQKGVESKDISSTLDEIDSIVDTMDKEEKYEESAVAEKVVVEGVRLLRIWLRSGLELQFLLSSSTLKTATSRHPFSRNLYTSSKMQHRFY